MDIDLFKKIKFNKLIQLFVIKMEVHIKTVLQKSENLFFKVSIMIQLLYIFWLYPTPVIKETDGLLRRYI